MRARRAEQVLSLKIYYPSFPAAELAQVVTGHSFDTTTTTWPLTAVRPGHGAEGWWSPCGVVPWHRVSRIVSDIGRALQSAAAARYPAAGTLVCRAVEISQCPCTLHLPKDYYTDYDYTFSSIVVYVCVWILWLRGSDIFFSAVFGIILFRGTTKDLILFRFTTERKDFPCQLEPDKSSQTSLFLHCPQWQSEQITSQASLSVKDTTGRKCIKNQDIYPLSNILFPEPMTHSVLGHFIIKSWKSKL